MSRPGFHSPPVLDKLWIPAIAKSGFASDDLDEVREYMDVHNGAHWRHARHPGAVGFLLWYRDGDGIRVAGCRMQAPQAIRGSVDTLTVHLTLSGRSDYRIGRRDIVTEPGDLVVLPAGRELTIEAHGLRRLVLQVPAIARERDGSSSVSHRSLPPAALASLHRALVALARVDGLPPEEQGVPRAHAESRLAGWMLGQLPGPAEARRVPRLAPERVRRIEAWIEAHLQEPLSLARLCEQAGVGARCLQVAFEAHRQLSPMAFVAERRLVAAHAALARGEYGSVTAVASAFGFEHPGRFAAGYRRLFGLSPSQMRRKSYPQF